MNSRILFICMFFIGVSCEDILETNISDDLVVLQLPADGFASSTANVTFWWNELEGASSYELLIVSPDYENPTSLVVDSLLTKNQFTMVLPIGRYQWCVKGVNEAYKTEFNCRSIEILN
ncbi:hypothetical protein [Ohtaekwangia koreensis]|uniref:Uncharacterized protein n=1 Tax=Ohtaekwangia koreensis TaxID=688867 RepID=A0A1T5K6M6_9BACT|nr:hypothetical protein [Ohtaekwangia koreensis]SKC59291.1 hypothetical protein SAMN05660236_1869 [Ohtaekwangia koreensis]